MSIPLKFDGGGQISLNSSMDKRISSNQEAEVRKGPWTMEEDLILINYISNHGEGVWNNIARSAGKSCRLRWLNYLRPDVRRGNITPEEQQLIMELHARWGNRWSKIAKQLPGRTDNEIKNFWRTRVQKKLKHGEYQNMNGNTSLTDEASTSAGALHPNAAATAGGSTFDTAGIPVCDDVSAAGSHSQHADGNFSTESNDNFWTVDDFWSMPSLNGD